MRCAKDAGLFVGSTPTVGTNKTFDDKYNEDGITVIFLKTSGLSNLDSRKF